MKDIIVKALSKEVKLSKEEIEKLIEIPSSSELGDYAFPCFSLAKEMKKNPVHIAKEIARKINLKEFEKIEERGPYVNFFIDRKSLALDTISQIIKEKEKYGSSKEGKGKNIVLDMSSPNIAKPFGIGHLRSTIIGNSLAEIFSFLGYNPVKINYLGDWGTQFGKMIVGWKLKGNKKKLEKEPIKHMLELYVLGNDEEYDEEAREWFKKLESHDKEAISLWKMFKSLSIKEFDKIYSLLNIKFDVISGESFYNNKMDRAIEELEDKNLLVPSEGADIVNLDNYNLGRCLIRKSDGATLYATRDLTAAIDRYEQYKFYKMIYEVGQEQKLHFNQVFKILELLGYPWAKDCIHVYHGLYLGKDGKKFATRQGKTVFMNEILDETISLAKKEIQKREKVSAAELNKRAKAIALAAIFYGDLKNYRVNDMVFDIKKFISFEGDTGPYLLYSYARARSILRKANYEQKRLKIREIEENEKQLIGELARFSEVIKNARDNLSPNVIANYAYHLSQKFNEFYHTNKVIGTSEEQFRLSLVDAFSIVLKDALSLLGISAIEKM